MRVHCDECGRRYDDARRWTICPHRHLDEPPTTRMENHMDQVGSVNPTQYAPRDDDAKKREVNFYHHPPKGDQVERYEFIRAQCKLLAEHLQMRCPASRELSLAMTKLEEVMFWSNASIARNE